MLAVSSLPRRLALAAPASMAACLVAVLCGCGGGGISASGTAPGAHPSAKAVQQTGHQPVSGTNHDACNVFTAAETNSIMGTPDWNASPVPAPDKRDQICDITAPGNVEIRVYIFPPDPQTRSEYQELESLSKKLDPAGHVIGADGGWDDAAMLRDGAVLEGRFVLYGAGNGKSVKAALQTAMEAAYARAAE